MDATDEYQPKNTREWFLHYLFNDEEFVAQKTSILTALDDLVGSEGRGVMFMVLPEPSLCEQLRKQSEYTGIQRMLLRAKSQPLFNPHSQAVKIIGDIEALAEKFKASVATVEQGLKYSHRFADYTFNSLPYASIEGDEVVLRINATARKKDIDKAYRHVMKLQKQLPHYQQRNRSVVRPDLIYAIYRQRIAKPRKTFREIYELYSKKELPSYGGANSLDSEESLERHYNRYKADI